MSNRKRIVCSDDEDEEPVVVQGVLDLSKNSFSEDEKSDEDFSESRKVVMPTRRSSAQIRKEKERKERLVELQRMGQSLSNFGNDSESESEYEEEGLKQRYSFSAKGVNNDKRSQRGSSRLGSTSSGPSVKSFFRGEKNDNKEYKIQESSSKKARRNKQDSSSEESDIDNFILGSDEEREEEEERLERIWKQKRKEKKERKRIREEKASAKKAEKEFFKDKGGKKRTTTDRSSKKAKMTSMGANGKPKKRITLSDDDDEEKDGDLQQEDEDEEEEEEVPSSSEEEEEEEEEELVPERRKRKSRRRKSLDSSDDDDEDEEAVDGHMLYWQVDQMREDVDNDDTFQVHVRLSTEEAFEAYLELLARVQLDENFLESIMNKPKDSKNRRLLAASKQIEDKLCTIRESLLGSGAWSGGGKDLLREIQQRPFYIPGPRVDASHDERCDACNRASQSDPVLIYLFGAKYNAKEAWMSSMWTRLMPRACFLWGDNEEDSEDESEEESEEEEGEEEGKKKKDVKDKRQRKIIIDSDSEGEVGADGNFDYMGGEEEVSDDEDDSEDEDENSRKATEWWLRKWPGDLTKGDESRWHLSGYCKAKTQLYHTLIHYKLRLLLHVRERLEFHNRSISSFLADNLFINHEIQRHDSLMQLTQSLYGGKSMNSSNYESHERNIRALWKEDGKSQNSSTLTLSATKSQSSMNRFVSSSSSSNKPNKPSNSSNAHTPQSAKQPTRKATNTNQSSGGSRASSVGGSGSRYSSPHLVEDNYADLKGETRGTPWGEH